MGRLSFSWRSGSGWCGVWCSTACCWLFQTSIVSGGISRAKAKLYVSSLGQTGSQKQGYAGDSFGCDWGSQDDVRQLAG